MRTMQCNGINFTRRSCHNNPSEKIGRIEPPQKPNKDHYPGALVTGGGGFVITVKCGVCGVTVSTNFLGRRSQNLLCTVQYGADMIVSVHVAPPLSDISTFKAVFGLGRLVVSDPSLIICLPWASGSVSTKQHLTISELKTLKYPYESAKACQKGLDFILFLSLLIMLSRSLITMTLHCSVSEILHGLWTKRRQFDTTNHNCGDSASFFVAASLLGPRIFSFLSDWELLHGLSSIISWVGLVSFSLTLHTSWLFLATFDSVHVHTARINQCLRPLRHPAGRQVELMTASREYIFLRNCQPATLILVKDFKSRTRSIQNKTCILGVFQGFKERNVSCRLSKVYKYSVASCWESGGHCRAASWKLDVGTISGTQHLFV